MIRLPSWFAPSFKKATGISGLITSLLMKKANFFVYPAIDAHADFADGMNVLEIGFGPGVGIHYLFTKYKLSIDGVDFSRLMCNAAGKKNKRYIKDGLLHLYCSDFLHMEFGDKRYDRIIFSNVIYFWDDIEKAFRKIKQLLKEDGLLVFYISGPTLLRKSKISSSQHFTQYSENEVITCLESCGFSNSESIQIHENTDWCMIIRTNA